MTTSLRSRYLSFTERTLHTSSEMDQSPIQAHLDTLFAEFSRSRPRLSLPPSPVAPMRAPSIEVEHALPVRQSKEVEDESPIDLRALDYVSDYDSHLMCPICHVAFVDPLVLDCDHTFCRACFEEYRDSALHTERSQCPTCRAYLLSPPHKASRLIANMCNDVRVRCPNEDCGEVHPRGCILQHSQKDCHETMLSCPDSECGKMVRRKNFVPDQCIHSSHIECDCGAIIELGRGEWLKHKDEDCPTTGVKCELCEERISVKDYLAGRNAHVCKEEEAALVCPGAEFGCIDELTLDNIEEHRLGCPIARMAPHLKKQSQLLSSLTSQLHLSKVRNEVLETGLDKVSSILHDQVLPSLPARPGSPSEHDLDIEEIPRHPPASRSPGLALPAHLRPLTPDFQPSSQEILALHNNLQDSITTLSTTLIGLQHSVAELDARTSMTMMNETLRLKEDLAHQSAGLFSTRAQVQWLLNRERERMMSMRGRSEQGSMQGVGVVGDTALAGSSRGSTSGEGGADLTSTDGSRTSPMMAATNMMSSPRVRPTMRRLSGSQERVKL